MNVFDYIEKELDRIEVGYTSYDGTKITLTMDEVRELVQNIKKKYKPDRDTIYRSDAIDEIENYPHGCTWNVESMKDMTDRIKALPSAELEKMQLSREDATFDCISRKAAIMQVKNIRYDADIRADKAIDDVIYALEQLPSAQPERTDCEYCHEDFDGCVRSIEKNSHAWLVRRGRIMKLRIGFKGEYRECDIVFCPMCGRRLTDG